MLLCCLRGYRFAWSFEIIELLLLMVMQLGVLLLGVEWRFLVIGRIRQWVQLLEKRLVLLGSQHLRPQLLVCL